MEEGNPDVLLHSNTYIPIKPVTQVETESEEVRNQYLQEQTLQQRTATQLK